MTVRSIWTGTISFGMVVIPVRLGPAVSEDGLPLHRVRKSDGSRLVQQNVALADHKLVPWADIRRGYELPDGRVVVLEDSDFDKAYGARNREAKIIAVTRLETLPRTAADASYHVEPGKGGEKAYALLEQTLLAAGLAAVVSFALRQRESLGLLYPDGNGHLILERLHWAAEVKEPGFEVQAPELTSAERDAALALIATMPQSFDWSRQQDAGAAALEAVVQAKVETGQVSGTPAHARQGAVTSPADLMAVLTASVEQARGARAPRARKPRARKVTEAVSA